MLNPDATPRRRRTSPRPRAILLAVGALLAVQTNALADEGMWVFNNLPLKTLKAKYGFEPTRDWIDHLRSSAVRFNSGGSGSFVSADGLVMTNHHVAADDLAKLSDEKNNYLQNGFHAKTRDQELKCKSLELNVLLGIKDVTAAVTAAVKPEMAPGDAFKARQAKIGEIEKAATDEPKNIRADVV